jgi:hypothetical protein
MHDENDHVVSPRREGICDLRECEHRERAKRNRVVGAERDELVRAKFLLDECLALCRSPKRTVILVLAAVMPRLCASWVLNLAAALMRQTARESKDGRHSGGCVTTAPKALPESHAGG